MKHLLPLIISGFVLCGFFAVCLCVFFVPRSEPESESVSEFDLFPPFQPVYLDFNGPVYSTDQFANSTFFISVPLDFDSYRFEWSYDLAGMGFNSVPYFLDVDYDDLENVWFVSYGNAIYTNSTFDNFSLLDDNCVCYFICNVYDLDSDLLLHSYRFSYQFFDFPSSSSSAPLDPETEDEPEPEPEPETEDEPEPEPEPETEDEPEPELER